ncbi:uncharacterized protein LOC123554542 isoform X2 [Mercenaria mercenaria]|uniref:uncharacterized protein LOC123554542 isoform X2 n=1 Tax=Mercenaria mercenaria TaxID=6596 RepID=UPI00234F6D11|nr:uncharacterized protein LOC123554542 isoform X2 [Mercenaria mercenaria]
MENEFKVGVMINFAIVVGGLATVLSLVISMPDLPTTIRNDHLCLPNEYGHLICGTSTELLHGYLQRIISSKYDEVHKKEEDRQHKFLDENRVRLMSIYNKAYWEMKPAAKLTGIKQPDLRSNDIGAEMVPIRAWRHGRELYDMDGFERYGIRYRNGRLVVPVSGTYLVYSFLDMFDPCNPSTGTPNINGRSKAIKHGIFKFNILDGEETEIVSSVQPHQVSSNRIFNSYSSYVSSLANLKAGDELSVKRMVM